MTLRCGRKVSDEDVTLERKNNSIALIIRCQIFTVATNISALSISPFSPNTLQVIYLRTSFMPRVIGVCNDGALLLLFVEPKWKGAELTPRTAISFLFFVLTDIRCVLTDFRCVLTNFRCVLTNFRCVLTDIRCILTTFRIVLTDFRCILTDFRCV